MLVTKMNKRTARKLSVGALQAMKSSEVGVKAGVSFGKGFLSQIRHFKILGRLTFLLLPVQLKQCGWSSVPSIESRAPSPFKLCCHDAELGRKYGIENVLYESFDKARELAVAIKRRSCTSLKNFSRFRVVLASTG